MCGGNFTVGSNPTATASFTKGPSDPDGPFVVPVPVVVLVARGRSGTAAVPAGLTPTK